MPRFPDGLSSYWNTGDFLEAQAGFLAYGSFYSPLLPGPLDVGPVDTAAFVPVYSGGTATASHRLPF